MDDRYYTAAGRNAWRHQRLDECRQQLAHLKANRLTGDRASRVMSALAVAKHDETGQLMSAWGDKGPFLDFNAARRVDAVIRDMGF